MQAICEEIKPIELDKTSVNSTTLLDFYQKQTMQNNCYVSLCSATWLCFCYANLREQNCRNGLQLYLINQDIIRDKAQGNHRYRADIDTCASIDLGLTIRSLVQLWNRYSNCNLGYKLCTDTVLDTYADRPSSPYTNLFNINLPLRCTFINCVVFFIAFSHSRRAILPRNFGRQCQNLSIPGHLSQILTLCAGHLPHVLYRHRHGIKVKQG